jgi:hypothetical protein
MGLHFLALYLPAGVTLLLTFNGFLDSFLRNIPKDCFQCKLYILQNNVTQSRNVTVYTDLAKHDMSAHVSSHALIEFPPGVLKKEGNINFIPTSHIITG